MKEYLRKALRRETPFFVGIPAFIWLVLYFYVPLTFIVLLSFLLHDSASLLQGLTITHYLSFLTYPYVWIFLRSLFFAFTVSCACLCIGYSLAYFLAFKAGRFKTFFLFLVIIPFFTNFLLHIYAWFFVLERNGFLNNLLQFLGIIKEPLHFLNTAGATLVVMVYCYLPFMVLPLYSILEKFDRKLIESSLDLGATAWQTFTRITIPLTISGIQSGFFLVFIPAFGEFVIPGLVGGDKSLFVGTVISTSMLGAHTMADGAAFTVLTGVLLVVVAALLLCVIRSFERKGNV